MSRLGKSFKNRFLRQALAIALAGSMVMSGMPVSAAVGSPDTEESVEAQTQSETENVSEEADEEPEAEETESGNSTEEPETVSEEETESDEENNDTKPTSTKAQETEAEETEESDTETEEASETDESEEENAEYTSSDAALADGHTYARWGATGGTLIYSNESAVSSNVIQGGNSGIYKNAEGDILYIDTKDSSGSDDHGKFAPNGTDSSGNDRIQINANTKIYIPVKAENNAAKITIYQNIAKTKDTVIYDAENNTDGCFDISGSAECTAFETSGGYYKTELTCTLNDESNIICVEVKKDNTYVTMITSGEKVRDDLYEDTAGDSADLRTYDIEGYANDYGVTGGGAMKINADNYYKVSTAEGFLQALADIKKASEPAVIRVTKNLNLGSREIEKFSDYSTVITESKYQALCHPTLKTSGVSDLNLTGFSDLTIFSTNGAAIKHCNIILKQSQNIIFRNLVFDELWEWDDLVYYEAEDNGDPPVGDALELSEGDYDRNDWDYICIDSESDGIWIDHCTFYKAYDGVIDIKNPKDGGEERVTISWCKFEEKSAPDENGNHPFYDEQIQWLKENIESTDYYRALMAEEGTSVKVTATDNKIFEKTADATIEGEGFSDALIESYTRGQKKTHLFGQSDKSENAVGIRATLANNIYKNSMDRMPRIRFGIAHVYNSVLDSSDIYYAHRLQGGDSAEAKAERAKLDGHLVSNGAISTKDAHVFLDTCYIDGIEGALLSGNGSSTPGYIGAVNCEYKLGDTTPALEITYKNNTANKDYELSKDSFEEILPNDYKYNLYDGNLDGLSEYLSEKAGAGVISMSDLQWTKVSYGDGNTDTSNPTNWDPAKDNDPAEDDNNTEPTDPETPDEEEVTYEDIEISLSASELTAGTYTTNVSQNGFTIKAQSGSDVVVSSASIDLKGAGSADSRSIHFTAESAGTLTVNAIASSNRVLELYKADGTKVSEQIISETKAYTYTIEEKGDYYIRSKSSSIKISSIKFTGRVKYITKTVKFRATDLADGELTEDLPAGEDEWFTVKTDSEIAAAGETIGEETFTKRVVFSGEGGTAGNSIQIKALGEGTLTIYAASSSTNAVTVNLLDSTGAVKDTQSVSNATSFTMDIDEKGIYYVASAGSGLYLYGIDFRVTYKEGETIEVPEPEPEAPIFTAPEPEDGKVFGADEGNEQSKTVYNIEGYAASANVTGGGLLKEDSKNYYPVENEQQFINALNSVRSLGTEGGLKPADEIQPAVIEIKNDLNLGCLELMEQGIDVTQSPAKTVIRGVSDIKQPLIHPTLKETGVSVIKLNYFHNLTIYSKNGASIKHCGINFEGETNNIIIRNITFDEFWEWDEKTSGAYDENDWDYMTVGEQTDGIWIDHCTFYKSYDGIVDIKGDQGKKIVNQRVTLSWCEFLPGSKDNTFFNEQMVWLEEHLEETTYYKQLRQTMSKEEIWWYAYGQKKTHLFGADDADTYASMIRATLANNYYKNSMDRMPRLRFGKVHEYNCVLDAQMLYTKKTSGSSGLSSSITSQGAISACGGEMLLENCYIRGILHPLYSGNGTSSRGYINAIESIYYMDGSLMEEVKLEKSGSDSEKTPLATDPDAFKEALPYSDYITYDATQLYTKVVPFAGAGKLDMSTVQWEKTNYSSRTGSEGGTTSASPSQNEPAGPNDELPRTPWDNPENPDDPNPPAEPDTVGAPTALPANEATFESTGGEITLNCADGAIIYYTISDTKDGLTDPADATNTDRKQCTTGTIIQITKETYIWAVAVKDNKTSEPLNCHYTILPEGAVVKPIAVPGSETQTTSVMSGDTVSLLTTAAVDDIYYTKGVTPDATADPTKEDSGREIYNNETGIIITEAVTIKAVAKKGNTYSDVATFTYTIKTDTDPGKTVTPPTFSKSGGVVEKGTKITIDCETTDAAIYYTTDGSEPKAEEQFLYTKGTEIVIDKTMTIRAIAVKDEIFSTESKVTYTVTGTESPSTPGISDYPDDPGTEDIDRQNIWITGLKETYAYTGAKIIPDIRVWDCDIKGNDRLLAPGIDYTVSYKNNTKPGNADVIVSGKGNYVGKSVTASFLIKEAQGIDNPDSVKGAKIDKIKDVITYSGEANYPSFTLTLKNKPAVTYNYDEKEGGYVRGDGQPMTVNIAVSNNINKGTATILVSGAKENGKVTSVKTTFKILPADLSKATVEATAGVYAVKGATPGSLTVTYGGKTLVNGIDYTVKYGSNKKAGVPGTITVTGKGNYTKKAPAKTFSIEKLDMSGISVDAVTAYEKMAAGKVKATVTDHDGNALKASQYILKIYKEAEGDATYGAKEVLNAGATIYVEAVSKDGNLMQKTPRAEFKVGKDISKVKVVLADKNKKGIAYNGSPITLGEGDLTVTLKGTPLRIGEHYEIVAYSNNINKGTATAVIKGIGDYSGTKTIKFKITQKTMVKGSITNS